MLKEEVEVAKGNQRQGILKFLVVLLLTGFLLVVVFWLLPKLVSVPGVDNDKPSKTTNQSAAQSLGDQANNKTPVISSQYTQEQALDAIKAFDQQLLLVESYQALQNDIGLMQSIDRVQTQVTQAFTQANYDTVVLALQQLSLDIDQAINIAQLALEQHLRTARQLWNEKQLPQLQVELKQAQAIQADLPEWVELNDLLMAWPEVESLLSIAKTAGFEGRYQEQLQALTKISRLSNDLPQLTQQIADVKRQVAEDQYRQAIAKADAAKRIPDLRQMRAAINMARQVYSQRPEVIRLTQQLVELERQQDYQLQLSQAELSLTKDQWALAFKNLSAAHDLYPNQRDTRDKKAFVAVYLKLMQESAEILNQPSLLTSAVKRKRVVDMLDEMVLYRSLSLRMANIETELSKQLQRYSQKVTLKVLSDNKTYVEVRSVGKVGVVTEKMISLLPGNYLFEGKRVGYVTKMVKVVITPEDLDKKVKVIANERI